MQKMYPETTLRTAKIQRKPFIKKIGKTHVTNVFLIWGFNMHPNCLDFLYLCLFKCALIEFVLERLFI